MIANASKVGSQPSVVLNSSLVFVDATATPLAER